MGSKPILEILKFSTEPTALLYQSLQDYILIVYTEKAKCRLAKILHYIWPIIANLAKVYTMHTSYINPIL